MQYIVPAQGEKDLVDALRMLHPFLDMRALVDVEDPKFSEVMFSLDEAMVPRSNLMNCVC